jgi:DNA-3-methyladenine glycosylase II
VELALEVRPAGPFRLPGPGMDGVLRRRGGVIERLLHLGEEPVRVRVAHPAPDRVAFAASARTRPAAAHGIARMRFAVGVDEDLGSFRRRFLRDPLIGPSLRRRPWLRVRRRPEPFEALAWAICQQLIEYERAVAIERRLVVALGRTWTGAGEGERTGEDEPVLRDVPTPAALAAAAPALLRSLDLAESRALALVRASREVARGRVDLHDADHERGWRRLLAIPGIGRWTVEMLALHGQGRNDQLPAGDVGLLKLAGRLLSGGDPRARADEAQVRELFAPYGEWAGLAAWHLLTP